jgi:hypothetical protein
MGRRSLIGKRYQPFNQVTLDSKVIQKFTLALKEAAIPFVTEQVTSVTCEEKSAI